MGIEAEKKRGRGGQEDERVQSEERWREKAMMWVVLDGIIESAVVGSHQDSSRVD